MADSGSTVSSYVDAAASGMSYIYRVQALNAAGLGPPGEVGAQTPPGRPRVALEAELQVGEPGDEGSDPGLWDLARDWRVADVELGVGRQLGPGQEPGAPAARRGPRRAGRASSAPRPVHSLGWTDIRCRRGRPSCARAR